MGTAIAPTIESPRKVDVRSAAVRKLLPRRLVSYDN